MAKNVYDDGIFLRACELPLFRRCFRESRSQRERGPFSRELRVSGRQVGANRF